jgi:hypothetical protein
LSGACLEFRLAGGSWNKKRRPPSVGVPERDSVVAIPPTVHAIAHRSEAHTLVWSPLEARLVPGTRRNRSSPLNRSCPPALVCKPIAFDILSFGMVRRGFAFVVVLVVLGTPVARDICDAACREHVPHPATSAAQHHQPANTAGEPSHHGHLDAESVKHSTNATLDPAAQSCRDLASRVGESRDTGRACFARAARTSPGAPVPGVDVRASSDVASGHGPRPGPPSTAPLRI